MTADSTTTASTDDTTPKLSSLAPKFSEKHHGVYLSVVKRAIEEQRDVKNIALAGTYGTGKSSILRELGDAYPGRVIELSLLTLGAKPEVVDSSDDMNPAAATTTNRIQKEIVKQLLYQQKPTDAPESRFKRISRVRWRREFLHAGIASVVGIVFALIFGVGVTTNPSLSLTFDDRSSWLLTPVVYVAGAALLAGVVLGFRALIRGRAAIERLNAGPATITLPPRSSSYFDEYLDEIIYFFEMNEKIDIVIIEDLDRFNDPHIFEALRSLNNLLNAAHQLDQRDIRFIYAIRDSVFGKLGRDDVEAETDEVRAEIARANRTKFFELIIPVVPFITHKNARDVLHELLTERGHAISKDLVNLVARHLADMRLVQNIVNEYEIFKNRLFDVAHPVPGLDPDSLFAMVVYKNALMADFEAIRLGSSTLDKLWDRWRTLVQDNITRLETENAERHLRIAKRDSATRYAEQLGDRLREAVDALHGAPGSGLATTTIEHAGANVDDAALRSPDLWQAIGTSATPLVLQAWRNATRGAGPMSLDRPAVETLLGMQIDVDRFAQGASDGDRAQLSRTEERLNFLRRHTWQQLAERADFSSGAIGGEHATFRDWITSLLPSTLAVDLVVNGFVTQYFSLYVSAFYGQLIRPDAMLYIMKHVDVGSADAEYPLNSDDVEAIIRDQGPSVLLERSMLNVSILNHLLRRRRADAATVVRLLPVFDEDGAFLERYFAAGNSKQALVELSTPRDSEIFIWLASRASLTDTERLKLIGVAARHRDPGVNYNYTAELRTFLEANYRTLLTLSGKGDARHVQAVVDLIAASGAVVPDLRKLPVAATTAFRGTRAYALTARNLEAVTGGHDFSLDALKDTHPAILDYATDQIGTYLAVVWDSSLTTHTVKSQPLFDNIIRTADWDDAQFAALIQKAAPECLVSRLAEYPVASWDALAEFGRVPMTFSNVQAYLDKRGQVTASLVPALEAARAITGLDSASQEQRTQMALAIVNATASTLTTDARIHLALSLEPGQLDTGSIQPVSGDLVGALIYDELIADDQNAFSTRLMVDWPTQAHAIKRSRNFASFIGPATLEADFVREFFRDRDFEELWPHLATATLRSYTGRMPLALAALTDRVVAGDATMDVSDIEVARSRGLADAKVIELLAHFASEISFDDLTAMLTRLGGEWAQVAKRGTKPHFVPNTAGAEQVLVRLERGGIVSSKTLHGRGFKVNPKRPRR